METSKSDAAWTEAVEEAEKENDFRIVPRKRYILNCEKIDRDKLKHLCDEPGKIIFKPEVTWYVRRFRKDVGNVIVMPGCDRMEVIMQVIQAFKYGENCEIIVQNPE